MATKRIRVIVLGQPIDAAAIGRGHRVEENSKDYVLWTYCADDPIEMQRAAFEVACEQLWQTVRVGMPPRSPN